MAPATQTVGGCVVGVVAGDNRGASSWSGGEKTRNATRNVDKVSDKTLVAIYSRTASELRTNFVTSTFVRARDCVHV